MSSIQVGLPDNGAPKKVLTQGRTHTDIFGTSEPVQPTPKKSLPKSSIQVLMDEADVAKEKLEESKDQKENKTQNGNAAGHIPTPQRVRMPPGGFSTKLW